jgi:hypothetical protein
MPGGFLCGKVEREERKGSTVQTIRFPRHFMAPKDNLPPYGISRHSDLFTKCASMIIGLALDTLVIKMSKLQ